MNSLTYDELYKSPIWNAEATFNLSLYEFIRVPFIEKVPLKGKSIVNTRVFDAL